MFSVLIPTLIATAMTVPEALALVSLVPVAGNVLGKCLMIILNALIKEEMAE